MENKFLNENGLAFFARKIKEVFATKEDVDETIDARVEHEVAHAISDVTQDISDINDEIDLIKTSLASPFNFKGDIDSASSLPLTDNQINDTYYITDEGCLKSWNGTSWEQSSLSETQYLDTLSDIEIALAKKLDKPHEGTPLNYDEIYNGVLYNLNNGFVENSSYNVYKFNVSSGDIVHIKGVMPAVNNVLYAIFNSDDERIDYAPASLYSENMFKEIDVTIPLTASYMYVLESIYHPVLLTEIAVVRTYIDDISDKLNEIDDLNDIKLNKPQIKTDVLTPVEVYDHQLYNISTGVFVTISSSVHYYTEKYEFNGEVKVYVEGIQPSTVYHLISFYDENGVLLLTTPNDMAGTGKKTITINVPENAVYAYVSNETRVSGFVQNVETIDDISPYIERIEDDAKPQLTAKRFETYIEVIDGDFIFQWGKNGANNLPNLKSAKRGDVTLFQSSTDWLGPYDFLVTQNADGDRLDPDKGITSSNTTGGNHDIHSISESAPTANNIALNFYCDGKSIEVGEEVKCTNVKITWTNKVCAGNTAKLDGTGRFALEEHGFAEVIGGGQINVGVTFIPLEEIVMNWYSGLQSQPGEFMNKLYIPEYQVIPFITSHEAGWFRPYTNTDSVEYANCIGDDITLEMFMNRQYGIAKRIPTSRCYDAGNGSTKVYAILYDRYEANHPTLIQGGNYAWKGHYKFYPTF